MDKWFAENKPWGVLLGADIFFNSWYGAFYFITSVSGWMKVDSWQNRLMFAGMGCAYLLKSIGGVRIWQQKRTGVAVLGIGIIAQIILEWPLFWANLSVKWLIVDVLVLGLAAWKFRSKPEKF